ncbi:hypothetical protein E2C01_077285 [Portunus trituberculatus]|uniref:Uncharacterized protein n=1 Tax=Portunus trituberculatus TaxID=210409 RepID=A0A5B7IE06_PORTR|nr:hypothetical protein [Portunus trituberculatus]
MYFTLFCRSTLPQPRQVINLKQMISDYTRLEDNIGDIGKGPPRAPSSQAEQQAGEEEEGSDLWDEKSVKPTIMLPHFSGEFRDLANIIQRVLFLLHLTHVYLISRTLF